MKMIYSVIIVIIGVFSGLMDECKNDGSKNQNTTSSKEWAEMLKEDSQRKNDYMDYPFNSGTWNTQESNGTPEQYLASDFDLSYIGVIVDFRPTDDYLDNVPLEKLHDIDIYIHIKGDDGYVHVERTDYATWVNLDVGDVLK